MIILEDKNNISYEEIGDLMESVGWGRFYYSSEAKFRYIMHATAHVAYIREDDRLIGYGRMIEDGINCLFFDVCVHPDYQKRGVGLKIMQRLIDKVEEGAYNLIGLFCEADNPTVANFYKKLGFEFVDAMDLPRLCRQDKD